MKFNYKDNSLIVQNNQTSAKKKKRKSNAERRHDLWTKNPHCEYCKRLLKFEESTLDHVIPKSYSRGKPKINNLVIACLDCNRKKSNLTKEEFEEQK